jgi:hypothetical protein
MATITQAFKFYGAPLLWLFLNALLVREMIKDFSASRNTNFFGGSPNSGRGTSDILILVLKAMVTH